MFTGIVEALGHVEDHGARGVAAGGSAADASRRLCIETSLPVETLSLGASIAVDGVCLTVVARAPGRFEVDLGPETLARTTLGSLRAGDAVNLERPLAVGEALGGHLVSGHVDGVGEVVAAAAVGDAWRLEVRAPPAVVPYLVAKGSVTLCGVSLTVNEVASDRFSVLLIPHTLAVTTLREKMPGAAVNVEADLLAKHVAQAVEAFLGAGLQARVDALLDARIDARLAARVRPGVSP